MPPWTWIPVTLFAVVMQSVRTAGQKHLAGELDPITVTLVRFLFGLPFALAYLAVVAGSRGVALPAPNAQFALHVVLASVGQILATVALVHLFSLRNFAVGTTYARTEAFLTALLGAALYGERVTGGGWLAIVVSVAGVVVLTVARTGLAGTPLAGRIWNRAAAVGLGSGLGFAVASLSLRRASHSFGIDDPLLTAGMVLVCMVTLQTLILLGYVAWRMPSQLGAMWRRWPVALFVGATSAFGSMGWFVAMTLERAAYVKALGQIEFLLALGISTAFFRERTSRLELAGMGLVAAGIVVLVLAG